ncbi:armadillo-type protein [Hygrophoropsis aurantiaca]|uniref:Armadillo-type protein n=1 Tax=Hygrophoropsis aurantiaca TaxID=72124 RepID=A0ACB8AT52_9AGAM|nr:armadillo-type protein [Hygrophoropsis aurantiaca]
MMGTQDTQSQESFKKLKIICVPLLENSQLTPKSVSIVLRLLSNLLDLLNNFRDSHISLSTSLVSYIFFPISTILRRNVSAAIPDQVLEKLLSVLGILCESWWWDCEIATWDQIFMLCGSIIGGVDGKGKNKDRDDETKEAAAQCLWSLLRERDSTEYPSGASPTLASRRLAELQQHSQTTKLIPVLGQTLDYLLQTATSQHMPLQRISLKVLRVLIGVYASEQFVPSVLPGVMSNMTKIALGIGTTKGWANGEIVVHTLAVMEQVIVRSIGDDVCIRDGAVRSVVDLEDFSQFASPEEDDISGTDHHLPPYLTARTSTWLRASSSQLHIALNTLTPLVTHPTSSALLALCTFSKTILGVTSLTLPQSQPLLLSWLLSLSNSPYSEVSTSTQTALIDLMSSSSTASQLLMQTLLHISKESLSALPRSIASQADAKVEHIAGQIEAISRLAKSSPEKPKQIGLSISSGIELLLGPTGGIEKWGWTLLSVLEFTTPSTSVNKASIAQLFLEGNADANEKVSFPEATLKNLLSRSAQEALARMFRTLGHASGDSCLYAVEWFVSIARGARTARSVAGLWCAARLLEGISGISLDPENNAGSCPRRSKKLESFSRGLARDIAELWNQESDFDAPSVPPNDDHRTDDILLQTEITKGFKPIKATLQITEPRAPLNPTSDTQPLLHRSFSLHLLSITAGILQARYTSLLIHVLYPVLHSLVSPISHLSLTALAALDFITNATSYASPVNLLLSHFDYALDAVSRRLSRRWLDVNATKVLAVLVRLVGSEVVQKAGDVVEECFDRLDEYHGYEIVVEGLVEVLGEVVKVIEADEPHAHVENDAPPQPPQAQSLKALFEWVSNRKATISDEDNTDYGPAPQKAWGDNDSSAKDNEGDNAPSADPGREPPLTPAQTLTKQMVSRSIYFLTHGSPTIRARILTLLSSATPVLSESALLPSIHHAWPFVLNRLGDNEPFVVSAAAALIEALVTHVGSFMGRRIWDDVWPRFRTVLAKLDVADSHNALARRGLAAVGTESAYTHSHRLYRSILKTMTAATNGVHMQDTSAWDVILAFRRFLHSQAHEELQGYARELYKALAKGNEDAVWLALMSTSGKLGGQVIFLRQQKWNIDRNVEMILTKA